MSTPESLKRQCPHDAAGYRRASDNFYCIHCNQGMGVAFYVVAKENMELVDSNDDLHKNLTALAFKRPYDTYWSRRALAAEARNKELELEHVGIRTALEREFSGPGETVGDDILDAMGVFIDHHKLLEQKLEALSPPHETVPADKCNHCKRMDLPLTKLHPLELTLCRTCIDAIDSRIQEINSD